MKVSELIEQLQAMPAEAVVVCRGRDCDTPPDAPTLRGQTGGFSDLYKQTDDWEGRGALLFPDLKPGDTFVLL